MSKCEHKYTRIVPSGNETHYAKKICTDCHRFVMWVPKGSPLSTNLFVPFEEKDEAKALGARWDPCLQLWYAPTEYHLKVLSKWIRE